MYRIAAAFSAAAVIAIAASPGAARAQTFNGAEAIHAVGIVDLEQFVLQRGDTLVETGKIGDVRVLAKSKAGFNYSLSGASCRHPGTVGCEGIFIQVRYLATPKVTDATLAAANTAFAALKVWEDADHKVVGISRYILLRDGVTRQNVLDNINLLVGFAPVVARVAFGGPLPDAVRPKR